MADRKQPSEKCTNLPDFVTHEWIINSLAKMPGMYDKETGWTERSQEAYLVMVKLFPHKPSMPVKIKNINFQCEVK